MNLPDDQLAELEGVFPNVAVYQEGNLPYLLIPQLPLPTGCSPDRIDVLLCPVPRDGYPSRLFFSERIATPRPCNWNANGVRIIERNWHAFSWKVNPTLRLIQQIAAHLRALQ
jgi:hypothetical protein